MSKTQSKITEHMIKQENANILKRKDSRQGLTMSWYTIADVLVHRQYFWSHNFNCTWGHENMLVAHWKVAEISLVYASANGGDFC